MSVLNQSGEEQVECPLCMEPLEVDDLNFFPCTCGYQICRFCWHRIRTDENGLCPACRKAYSEDPADFIPLSQEQVAKLKAEKRQRDQQRKAKLSESRKHLASVRVVQRNLVFVVGLPVRLADPEVLKKHEYFGKFGKIHKVVINQSTSYAGSQGPSASAYVTYMKSDDALRAIQSVNNITIDGRLVKSSLGTTKYCSHFMKNQPCPKPDCMYLHDFGDPEASFTKEQMHAGKHQEYEKKLHEALLQRTNQQQQQQQHQNSTATTPPQQQQAQNCNNNNNNNTTNNKEEIKPTTKVKENTQQQQQQQQQQQNGTNKENWPQLDNKDKKSEKDKTNSKNKTKPLNNNKVEKKIKDNNSKIASPPIITTTTSTEKSTTPDLLKLQQIIDDHASLFSHNTFQKIPNNNDDNINLLENDENKIENRYDETIEPTQLPETGPNIDWNEDWAAAFGFTAKQQITTSILQNDDTNGLKRPPNGFGQFSASQQQQQHTTSSPEFPSSSSTSSNLFNMSKIHENLIDALSNNKTTTNNYGLYTNGLEQNMSKFFMDFHRTNNGYQQSTTTTTTPTNGYYMNPERLLLLQQKKLEEQLLNLGLKQQQQQQQQNYQQNNHYYNGGDNGFLLHNNQFSNSSGSKILAGRTNTDGGDELDFDPFQETQKAFAELMATEQTHKAHSVRSQTLNGLHHSHNQTNGLPPPPPGFVQPSNHMNSFGSKILPFLNMSNSQINSSSRSSEQQQHQQQQQQQNWPSSFLSPQHKSPSNDWKDFDSAILTTSRHYPINMPPIRDHFLQQPQQAPPVPSQQQQQQQQQPPNGFRSNDYSAFSNFAQQLQQQQQQQQPPPQQPQQPNYNGFNNQPNFSWFNSELNTQISSPPGFRTNNQTTKQQEC